MSRYGSAALDAELDRLDLTSRGDRHRQLFASACALGELVAGGELSADRAAGALTEAGLRLGLGEADVRRTVDRGLERGRNRPRRAPATGVTTRTEALAEVVRWWEAIERCPPTGRTAGTTLRVLAGFRDLALRCGKLRLSQSFREVAEASGVSVATVHRRRADWQPWVRLIATGRTDRRDDNRSTWQLVTRAGRTTRNSPLSRTGDASGLFLNDRLGEPTLGSPENNLWHRNANAWRLWISLDRFDATGTSMLAAALDLSPRTVRRLGRRLVELELATRDEDGWRAVAVSFDTAARHHLDGFDHAGARRERHLDDRHHHRLWLEQRAAAAERPKLSLVPGPDQKEDAVPLLINRHEGVA